MKKAILIITATALLLLSACGSQSTESTPEPTAVPEYSYTEETFPRLAAGTTASPLAEALAAIVLGKTVQSAGEFVDTLPTQEAWDALENGDVSLVIAAEGSDMPSGVDLSPIAKEALVFCTGEGGVDSLTTEQLKSIISGEITDWQDVGGQAGEIRFSAPEDGSGSRAAVERLLGVTVTDGKTAGYSSDSLRCMLYYGADGMGLSSGMKLISVDGVYPSAETIASGEYPLTLEYLAGVKSSSAEASPERVLWLWLQGDVGQAFIASRGYVR